MSIGHVPCLWKIRQALIHEMNDFKSELKKINDRLDKLVGRVHSGSREGTSIYLSSELNNLMDLADSTAAEEECSVVLMVGNYQTRVQVLRASQDSPAEGKVRRLTAERQVQLTREAVLNRYRELSGQTRMY